MANNPNAVKNLRPAKKGQSGNPKGRPKKLKTILKKEGLKQSQINDIISEMLAMTRDEINDVIADPQSRSFEVLVGQAIKKGVSKGDLSQIFGYALTRAFGQPKQELEHKIDSGGVNITVVGISPEKEVPEKKKSTKKKVKK